jgi:hypothetical protein
MHSLYRSQARQYHLPRGHTIDITALIVSAILLTCFFIPTSYAQNSRASLAGRLLDPNGASISGAAVTLRQKTAGFERTSVTDAEGKFHFTELVQGLYQVQALALPSLRRSSGFHLAKIASLS